MGYVSSTVAVATDENWLIPPKETLSTQQILLFEEQEIGDSWFETGTPEVLLPRNVPVAGTSFTESASHRASSSTSGT